METDLEDLRTRMTPPAHAEEQVTVGSTDCSATRADRERLVPEVFSLRDQQPEARG